MWFVALRAPLWLDETVSYWWINGGFFQILSRQGFATAPYAYILWLASRILGTGEIALRIPSILAMLGAVYLLYRAGRELFGPEAALFSAVVFCIHPIVVFAAIDARPYAFGALAINTAILLLIRARNSESSVLAALLGGATASILYFHLLFAPILLAITNFFFLSKVNSTRVRWRSFGVFAVSLLAASLPIITSILLLFQTANSHVFANRPGLIDLLLTLAPSALLFGFVFPAVLIACPMGRVNWPDKSDSWGFWLCLSLALVPAVTLYAVSVASPVHVFVERYCIASVPGIALSFGWVLSRVNSRGYRALFCVSVLLLAAYGEFTSPSAHQHGYTWKYALEFAEKKATADHAEVVICSDLPESDHMPMPVGPAVKDSALFAPLTYYRLTGPVVPLPRSLNDRAIRLASEFLQDAEKRRQPFLALAFIPSYKTLEWLARNGSHTYVVRVAAQLDGIAVLEFIPRPPV